jgi:hypothetical protein
MLYLGEGLTAVFSIIESGAYGGKIALKGLILGVLAISISGVAMTDEPKSFCDYRQQE